MTATSKPSVLLVNRVYPPVRGASGRMLRDLAREMARAGWRVSVLTTGEKTFTEKDGDIAIQRISAPQDPRGVFSYSYILLKLFIAMWKMPRHDLLISMTDPPMLVALGRFFSKKHQMPHLHWCHDLYPDLFHAIGMKLPDFVLKMLARISRRSMNKSDKVVVVGRCMARHLSLTGVDAGKISLVTNWPDFEIVDTNTRTKKSDIRIKRDVMLSRPADTLFRDDSPRFRVLYAGNIGRAHPMKAILEAAGHLSSMSEVEFAFVGEGPNHDRLAQERGKKGLDNIKLLPHQPASCLKDLMEGGDIHLVSVRNEAAGLLVPCKFYSALAAGRPVIYLGPEDTEIARVIKDYGCGAIIPQGDGAMLAQAIRFFRLDANAWFDASQAAEEAAREFRPVKSILSIMKECELAMQGHAEARAKEKTSGGGG